MSKPIQDIYNWQYLLEKCIMYVGNKKKYIEYENQLLFLLTTHLYDCLDIHNYTCIKKLCDEDLRLMLNTKPYNTKPYSEYWSYTGNYLYNLWFPGRYMNLFEYILKHFKIDKKEYRKVLEDFIKSDYNYFNVLCRSKRYIDPNNTYDDD